MRSLSHWTTREVPKPYLFFSLFDMEEVFSGSSLEDLSPVPFHWPDLVIPKSSSTWELLRNAVSQPTLDLLKLKFGGEADSLALV